MHHIEICNNRKTQCKKTLFAKLAIRRYLRYLHGNWKCASHAGGFAWVERIPKKGNSVLHVATRNLAPDFPRRHVRHSRRAKLRWQLFLCATSVDPSAAKFCTILIID